MRGAELTGTQEGCWKGAEGVWLGLGRKVKGVGCWVWARGKPEESWATRSQTDGENHADLGTERRRPWGGRTKAGEGKICIRAGSIMHMQIMHYYALLCIVMQLGKKRKNKGTILRFYTENHYASWEK